ncbi:hypothetical protein [Ornithinimicrobium faecis]|uniref:DUF4352 domain-containing protein n=1 Tax=Ornithinimicrobium faecis TaxID=2934158 RepID=A0ABY4YZ47_9MICO|nr:MULTISPECIES: hypothetical protein [unclassified Ornithinimicrobium]USQ81720.1 hypothetical protein NF556_08765 [Ornithinimicrobium sp. HY1793]
MSGVKMFALASVGTLLLTACSGDDTAPISATVTATATVTAQAAPAEAPAAETVTETVTATVTETMAPDSPPDLEAEPASDTTDMPTNSDGLFSFGETVTYADGLELTVGQPEAYQPGQYAAGSDHHDAFVRFPLSMTNGTDEPVDASWIVVTVQSGTGEGERVFDAGNGISGDPDSTLLQGRTNEWDIVFGVDDPEDMVMSIAPGWDYDSMIYTNTQ